MAVGVFAPMAEVFICISAKGDLNLALVWLGT